MSLKPSRILQLKTALLSGGGSVEGPRTYQPHAL